MPPPQSPSISSSDEIDEFPPSTGITTVSASSSQSEGDVIHVRSPVSPPPVPQSTRKRKLRRNLGPEVVNLLSDGEDYGDDEIVLKTPEKVKEREGTRRMKRDRFVDVDDEGEVEVEVKKVKKVRTEEVEAERKDRTTGAIELDKKVKVPASPVRPLKKPAPAPTLEIEDSDGDDVVLRPIFASPPPRKVPSVEGVKPLGGMDRKQMEAERLERERKRLTVAPTSFYGGAKSVGVGAGANEWRFERPAWKSGTGTGSATQKATAPEPPKVNSPARQVGKEEAPKAPLSAKSPLKYPHGVVKKTSKQFSSKKSDEVRIEDVLDRDTLQTTLLSAFQWDFEWILSKLPARKTVLVLQAKGPEERRMKEQLFAEMDQIELVFPYMDGQVNCMHSKLMLLFHRDKVGMEWLRVVVPTANLTDYDWGMCGGIMENVGIPPLG